MYASSIIVGNIIGDISGQFLPDGTPVATVFVHVKEHYTNASGVPGAKESYFQIYVLGEEAQELLPEQLATNDRVLVNGNRIMPEAFIYDAADGSKGAMPIIVGDIYKIEPTALAAVQSEQHVLFGNAGNPDRFRSNTTGNGTEVFNASIAINHSERDPSDSTKWVNTTTWADLTFWGAQAKAQDKLGKGTPVLIISDHLTADCYEKKNEPGTYGSSIKCKVIRYQIGEKSAQGASSSSAPVAPAFATSPSQQKTDAERRADEILGGSGPALPESPF